MIRPTGVPDYLPEDGPLRFVLSDARPVIHLVVRTSPKRVTPLCGGSRPTPASGLRLTMPSRGSLCHSCARTYNQQQQAVATR